MMSMNEEDLGVDDDDDGVDEEDDGVGEIKGGHPAAAATSYAMQSHTLNTEHQELRTAMITEH